MLYFRMIGWCCNLCSLFHPIFMLQGFQVPYHSHMLIQVVFNQYLETILHLQCCCSQRRENYLLNVQTLESMFYSLPSCPLIMNKCSMITFVELVHQGQPYCLVKLSEAELRFTWSLLRSIICCLDTWLLILNLPYKLR